MDENWNADIKRSSMIYQIEILNDELDELTEIVDAVNAEFPGTATPELYLTNICMNFLSPRIRDVLVQEARTAPLGDLKNKLGKIKDLKTKQKNRGN